MYLKPSNKRKHWQRKWDAVTSSIAHFDKSVIHICEWAWKGKPLVLVTSIYSTFVSKPGGESFLLTSLYPTWVGLEGKPLVLVTSLYSMYMTGPGMESLLCLWQVYTSCIWVGLEWKPLVLVISLYSTYVSGPGPGGESLLCL